MTPERVAASSFVASVLGSIGLVAVYLSGGQPQAEGVLLFVALGGLGVGITLWATHLIDAPEETEERTPLASDHELDVDHSTEHVTRRGLLMRTMMAAFGSLAAALAIPTLSLGPQPGSSLFRTRWGPGSRVVNGEGAPVRPEDVPLSGVVTVFPEGWEGEADSQTLIVRVDPGLISLPPERADWVVGGCIGYSKICTHAGCPVGLYRSESHELLCPCHQTTFDVLTGARVVFGPAKRPLPQLPLALDEDGYLVARGDFPEPVGPSFWNMTSGSEGGS